MAGDQVEMKEGRRRSRRKGTRTRNTKEYKGTRIQ